MILCLIHLYLATERNALLAESNMLDALRMKESDMEDVNAIRLLRFVH